MIVGLEKPTAVAGMNSSLKIRLAYKVAAAAAGVAKCVVPARVPY